MEGYGDPDEPGGHWTGGPRAYYVIGSLHGHLRIQRRLSRHCAGTPLVKRI